jgi:hypothetical protein
MERLRQNARIFHNSKASFRLHLSFLAFQELLRRQLGIVAFVGGHEKTTMLIDGGLPRGEQGSQGSVDLLGHLIRLNASAGRPGLS